MSSGTARKTEVFRILYEFRFADNSLRQFEILLDRKSLAYLGEPPNTLPEWTQLTFCKCAICPLSDYNNARCPVAINLSGITDAFKERSSLDHADVSVIVAERTYFKSTTVPQGLSPLLGIIMATSGCPIMEPLKPMVRYHLPFASLEETVFRMVSMYLVGQFLRHHEGKNAEWKMDGLTRIYEEVAAVNRDFARRIHDAAKSDANANALVNLDIFAIMVPRLAEDMLQQIKPYFAAHLK